MPIQAVFNGVTYRIPKKNEVGWFDLTDYLYALSGAATTASMVFSTTNVTAATYTATTTDTTLLVNYAGGVTITLPAGSIGRFIMIYDKSGAAQTNNIEITGTGQTVDGSTYKILTNGGAVILQFDNSSSDWKVISEVKVIDEILSIADGASDTVTLTTDGSNIVITDDLRKSLTVTCEYASEYISCIADKNSLFADASGYIITKTANSDTVTIENNTGGLRTLAIRGI